MSKKSGFGPFVFLFDDIGDDTEYGGHSGSAGVRPSPCNFTTWQISYAQDLVDPIGTVDEADFKQWWINNEFSEEAWNELNSALGPLYGNGNDAAPIPGVDDGDGGESGGDAVSDAISEMMGDIPG